MCVRVCVCASLSECVSVCASLSANKCKLAARLIS